MESPMKGRVDVVVNGDRVEGANVLMPISMSKRSGKHGLIAFEPNDGCIRPPGKRAMTTIPSVIYRIFVDRLGIKDRLTISQSCINKLICLLRANAVIGIILEVVPGLQQMDIYPIDPVGGVRVAGVRAGSKLRHRRLRCPRMHPS